MKALFIPVLLLACNVVNGQTLLTPQRVVDMNPNGASAPSEFTVVGTNKDQLYFVWDNGVGGGSTRRVWIYA